MDNKKVKKFYYEKKIFYIRLELIKDFLFSLLDVVERTYLGDKLMTIANKKEHFEYCLDETILKFKGENIHINRVLKLQNFLFGVFFKYYYDVKKTKKNIEEFKMRVSNILSYSMIKKESHLLEINEYYKVFNESLGDFLIF